MVLVLGGILESTDMVLVLGGILESCIGGRGENALAQHGLKCRFAPTAR